MKMTLLQSAVMVSTVVLVSACSSVNNDELMEYNVQTNAAVYSCYDRPLSVLFHADQAQVTWEGEEYLLHQATIASGSFYFEEGVSFWIHQKEAKLTLEGMDTIQCHLVRIES